MNIEKLIEQAFVVTKETTNYDLKTELSKPLLSTARHRLKLIHGLTSQIIDFYEKLVDAHMNGDSTMTSIYHMYLRKIIAGDNSDFKGISSNLKMYFYIREFQEDDNKKKAVALYLKTLFDLIENQVTKLDAKRLEIINGIDIEYGKYYDSSYIFDTFREIPLEVINGHR